MEHMYNISMRIYENENLSKVMRITRRVSKLLSEVDIFIRPDCKCF